MIKIYETMICVRVKADMSEMQGASTYAACVVFGEDVLCFVCTCLQASQNVPFIIEVIRYTLSVMQLIFSVRLLIKHRRVSISSRSHTTIASNQLVDLL